EMSPEMPGQLISVDPADGFQLLRENRLSGMSLKIVLAHADGIDRRRSARSGRHGAVSPKTRHNAQYRIINEQVIWRVGKVCEKIVKSTCEHMIVNDRFAHEGQTKRSIASHFADDGRRQIEHAVDETILVAGSSVMDFIRMKD